MVFRPERITRYFDGGKLRISIVVLALLTLLLPGGLWGCTNLDKEDTDTGNERNPLSETGNIAREYEANNMEESTKPMKEPKLIVDIERRGDELEVSYSVSNKTSTDIFLFNVLWDMDPTGRYLLAEQQAYASLNSDGLLRLSKRVLPLPTGRKVEMRIIPFVTKIGVGDTFKDSFSLKMPVREYNPYFPQESEESAEERKSTAINFQVDFIRSSEDLKLNPTPLEGQQSVWHPDLFGSIESLESRPVSTEIDVMKRTDEFEEF